MKIMYQQAKNKDKATYGNQRIPLKQFSNRASEDNKCKRQQEILDTSHWFSDEFSIDSICGDMFPSIVVFVHLCRDLYFQNLSFINIWVQVDWIVLNFIIAFIHHCEKRLIIIAFITLGFIVDFLPIIYFAITNDYVLAQSSLIYSFLIPIFLYLIYGLVCLLLHIH